MSLVSGGVWVSQDSATALDVGRPGCLGEGVGRDRYPVQQGRGQNGGWRQAAERTDRGGPSTAAARSTCAARSCHASTYCRSCACSAQVPSSTFLLWLRARTATPSSHTS